jgi:hypothetical protein
LENSKQQDYARQAATATVYIVLLQVCTVAFRFHYMAGSEKKLSKEEEDALLVKPMTVVYFLHALGVMLQFAFMVCLVVLFVGIFSLSKALPDVAPPARGDPMVL